MDRPRIVSRAEWLVARREFFEGPNGHTNLRDLFGPRRQLVIYHFMFDPSWDEGPLAKIESFKRRMGWDFPWLSSFGSDFYQRGLDLLLSTYNYLDLTPLGRQEDGDRAQGWIPHHDKSLG
jgi:predicted dithiol-disulfide oxidoreductase (DUF899 family)